MLRSKQSILKLILILIGLQLITAGITIGILYETAMQEQEELLSESVKGYAELLEAVARYDRRKSGEAEAQRNTLSQIKDAFHHFKGFGQTGEYILARKEGDQVVFLIRHHTRGDDLPKPIPMDSTRAIPMQKALQGESGVILARDYRDVYSLAAFAPLPTLNMGLVAKIDRAEIRAPFIRAAWLVFFASLALAALAVYLIQKVLNPILRRSAEAHSLIEGIFKHSPTGIFIEDLQGRYLLVNPQFEKLNSVSSTEVLGKTAADFLQVEEAQNVRAVTELIRETKQGIQFEAPYIKDGKIQYILAHCFPLINPQNKVYAIGGILMDVTEQRQAQKELQKSEERYRTLAELAPVGIFLTDNKGYCLDVNEHLCKLTDFSHEQLLQTQWVNAIHPAYLPEFYEKWQNFLQEPNIFQEEVPFLRSGNDTLWVYVQVQPQYNEEKVITGFIGSVTDIHQHKLIEEELRLKETALDNMAEAVHLVRADDHTIIYANKGFEKMFGYTQEEVLGTSVDNLNADHGRSAKDIQSELELILKEQGAWEGEIWNLKKDGSQLHSHTSITTFEHQHLGTLYLSVKEDITERKKAEQALIASENQYRTLVEIAQGGILRVSAEGDILFANTFVAQMLGYETSEIIGKSILDFIAEKNMQAALQKKERRVAGISEQYDFEYVAKDGTPIPATVVSTPMFNAQGEFDGAQAFLLDNSKRKKMEEELHELTQEMITAQEHDRSRFSFELHDDIAPLLSTLLIYVAMMKTTCIDHCSLGPQHVDLTTLVQKSIQGVRNLSYDLAPPDLKESNLKESITQLGNELKDAYNIDVHLDYSLQCELPEAEATHLYRIIQESLRNISNHAEATKVQIVLSVEGSLGTLLIEDDGKGFDIIIEQLRVKEQRRLGLRSMEGRARMIQGSMSLESTPSQGTRITIHFPLQDYKI